MNWNQVNLYQKKMSRLERKIFFSIDILSRLDIRKALSMI